MKISTVRRIVKEDLVRAGEVPAWIDSLLNPVNQFIDTVSQALRGNLSLGDNLRGKLVTIKLDHGVEKAISPSPLNSRVLGLLPLAFDEKILTQWSWRIKSDGQIGVTFYFSDSSTGNDCTFYLIAE